MRAFRVRHVPAGPQPKGGELRLEVSPPDKNDWTPVAYLTRAEAAVLAVHLRDILGQP